jgi:hypothetical protein
MLRHALIALLFIVVGLVMMTIATCVLIDPAIARLGQRTVDCGHIVMWDLKTLSGTVGALVMLPTGVCAIATGVVWLAARRFVRPFVVVTALGALAMLGASQSLMRSPGYAVEPNHNIC